MKYLSRYIYCHIYKTLESRWIRLQTAGNSILAAVECWLDLLGGVKIRHSRCPIALLLSLNSGELGDAPAFRAVIGTI
jgi:hypothetical protein